MVFRTKFLYFIVISRPLSRVEAWRSVGTKLPGSFHCERRYAPKKSSCSGQKRRWGWDPNTGPRSRYIRNVEVAAVVGPQLEETLRNSGPYSCAICLFLRIRY